jgi:AbrB family looped-hinge helix DNA binding protein
MIVTITSKGQITIPRSLRRKFHLNAGDKLDFDENAPVLIARRAVDRKEWNKTLADWKKSTRTALKGHPWEDRPSSEIIDDLRGDPGDTIPEKP